MVDGYDVVIRRMADGVERVYHDTGTWNDDEGMLFWWEEGNNSCDCSRHRMFELAAGNETVDAIACGDGLYRVERYQLPNGRVIADRERPFGVAK